MRLHGAADRLLTEVLPSFRVALQEPLETGLIAQLQVDTYVREVERFGGPAAIAGAESVFHADSEAVLTLLQTLHDCGAVEGSVADAAFWLALHGADRLLSDFDFTLPERIALYSWLQSALGQEFKVKSTRKRFSEVYRRHRRTLEAALRAPLLPERAVSRAEIAWCRRSAAVRRVAHDLRRMDDAGDLTTPLRMIVAALMHMHVNRLVRVAGRRQELAIYHLLMRAYEAKLARSEQPPL